MTPEEIWDLDDEVVTLGYEHLRNLLSEYLTKLPDETVKDVFKNCRFFVQGTAGGVKGEYLPKNLIANCNIFVFPLTLMKDTPEGQEFTIFHEIAHYFLGHKCGPGIMITGREDDAADELAKKWQKNPGVPWTEDDYHGPLWNPE